jgi:hypothetical protein
MRFIVIAFDHVAAGIGLGHDRAERIGVDVGDCFLTCGDSGWWQTNANQYRKAQSLGTYGNQLSKTAFEFPGAGKYTACISLGRTHPSHP